MKATDHHYSPNELALAAAFGFENAQMIPPNELYRGMVERVFVESREGRNVEILRRVFTAWQYKGVYRGTTEFEALFDTQSYDVAVKHSLTVDQVKKLDAWIAKQDKLTCKIQGTKSPNYGAIGGAVTLSFTPTGLGNHIKAKHAVTHNEIDLSDYENW